LPDCLPILHYGLFSTSPNDKYRRKAEREDPHLPLSALLSRVLLASAIEFERESDLSLAISANVLRVLDETGVGSRIFRFWPGCRRRPSTWRWVCLKRRASSLSDQAQPAAVPRSLASRTPAKKRRLHIVTCSHHRAALEGAVWRRQHPRSSGIVGKVGTRSGGSGVAVIAWARTPPRRLARVGTQAHDPATLSHGAAPRRIP
jgi:hypothetical protein